MGTMDFCKEAILPKQSQLYRDRDCYGKISSDPAVHAGGIDFNARGF